MSPAKLGFDKSFLACSLGLVLQLPFRLGSAHNQVGEQLSKAGGANSIANFRWTIL